MCLPGWKRCLRGKWIHVFAWLSLFSSETITALLISYTPIQNKKLKKINVRIWGGGVIDWEVGIDMYTLVVQSLKLCPTLYDTMDCSMSGSTVLHYLPEFDQTNVH